MRPKSSAPLARMFGGRSAKTDSEGSAVNGESKALVYTGYEWRGTAQYKDRTRREVFHVSEDGNRINGRWFDADHSEDGGDWRKEIGQT